MIETRRPLVDVFIASAYEVPRLPAPIMTMRGGEAENEGRSGAGRRTTSCEVSGSLACGAMIK